MLVKLDGIKSAEEALEKSGLAWSVEQEPLITGSGISVDTHKAVLRGDNSKIIGIVGSKYEPVQNTVAFAFFDVLAEKYGCSYEYAGIIKDGKKVFLQAKLGNSFEAAPGDQVDSYITMVNAHDGSASIHAFLTPIRLFCQNQLIRALKSATTNIKFRHTPSVNDRFKEAMNVFNMSTEAFQLFEEKAKVLAQKLVDSQMVAKFLAEIVPESGSTRSNNQREKIEHLFESGRGNTGETAWHLYNAAVEYVDHERSRDAEKALDSAMFGSGAILKEKAFEAAMSL
jgi:phage/plasmid-like protein (TIGR03299 family)